MDDSTMAPALEWAEESLQVGGTRWRASTPAGTFAAAVRLPGTLTRVYWNDGRVSDYRTPELARAAVAARFEARP